MAAEKRPVENAICGPTLKRLAHYPSLSGKFTSCKPCPRATKQNRKINPQIRFVDLSIQYEWTSKSHLILEESLQDERDQNHSSREKRFRRKENNAGEQNKTLQTHEKTYI